jgi:hypothetical protein
VTERVAWRLAEYVIARADCLIGLHSAGLGYDLVPHVAFDSSSSATFGATFETAKAAGIEHLYGSVPFPNVMRVEAVNGTEIYYDVEGSGLAQTVTQCARNPCCSCCTVAPAWTTRTSSRG